MSKIAIHGRRISDDSIESVKLLLHLLKKNKKEILVSPALKKEPGSGLFTQFECYTPGANMKAFEAIVSLGGDGTLLETLTHIGSAEVPILGINTGRLGFLATISKDDIEEALAFYFSGNYEYDDRTLLQLNSHNGIFTGKNYALNEFAILRKDTSSMIVVKCFLDGEYLNTYWADGLMVSTPTGSTGYSLSCGGPIIMPHTKNFIITPVSPHNLNVRPLIISENSVISFRIESRSHSFLVSLDSRSETIDENVELSIMKSDFKARLIRIRGNSFLDTLRNKLMWGLDKRN